VTRRWRRARPPGCSRRPDALSPSACSAASPPSGVLSATERSWSARSSEWQKGRCRNSRSVGSVAAPWPRACASRAKCRASGSVAYICAVPRKLLRGNWSSRIASARLPAAVPAQASSSRRAAAKCRVMKRSRNKPSNAASFLNQRSGPASRQKSMTDWAVSPVSRRGLPGRSCCMVAVLLLRSCGPADPCPVGGRRTARRGGLLTKGQRRHLGL
jgi:hypothetical protein